MQTTCDYKYDSDKQIERERESKKKKSIAYYRLWSLHYCMKMAFYAPLLLGSTQRYYRIKMYKIHFLMAIFISHSFLFIHFPRIKRTYISFFAFMFNCVNFYNVICTCSCDLFIMIKLLCNLNSSMNCTQGNT